MKRIATIIIVFLIMLGSICMLAMWFDVATSHCDRVKRSFIFNVEVHPANWWIAFIGAFVPPLMVSFLYMTDVISFKKQNHNHSI